MSDALSTMLNELRAQAERSREHENLMHSAIVESESWAEPDDRRWVIDAACEASQMRAAAERRLLQAEAIVSRVGGMK